MALFASRGEDQIEGEPMWSDDEENQPSVDDDDLDTRRRVRMVAIVFGLSVCCPRFIVRWLLSACRRVGFIAYEVKMCSLAHHSGIWFFDSPQDRVEE
jgi:hypothetical protein